jgi:hypothetical protein
MQASRGGLDTGEVDKLEALAERLRSPWTFLATADRAEDCPAIWPESQRSLPNAPRFCLSAEQLFEPMVFWAAGTNPLAWSPLDADAHAKREATYRRDLPDAVKWLAGTHRLDEQLIAETGPVDATSE